MPSAPPPPTDTEVLTNHLSLTYAAHQRASTTLLSQFLGTTASDDDSSSNDDHTTDPDKGQRHPDTAGVGYSAPNAANGITDPDDHLASRTQSAATERLRRQLLGKHARAPAGSVNARGGMVGKPAQSHAHAHARRTRQQRDDADSDEEVGRSAMGRAKTATKTTTTTTTTPNTAATNAKAVESPTTYKHATTLGPFAPQTETNPPGKIVPATTPAAPTLTKKRGTSYLDQLLAEREDKKKRKKAKKQQSNKNNNS
jgi:hypothetical protein